MHRDETRVLSPCETGLAHGHRCGPPPAQGQVVREGTQCPAPALPSLTFPGVLTQRYGTPYLSPSPGRGMSCEAGGGYSSISACLGWGQSPG